MPDENIYKERMKRKTNQHSAALTNRTTLRVRFSEIDSMQIVWHGEYVRYFEDGREAFGKQYGLDYMSIYREGYMVPIVDLTCQFKQSLCLWRGGDYRNTLYRLRCSQNPFRICDLPGYRPKRCSYRKHYTGVSESE